MIQELSAKVYEQAAQQQQQAQGANAGQNNNSTVEDAEFRKVKVNRTLALAFYLDSMTYYVKLYELIKKRRDSCGQKRLL